MNFFINWAYPSDDKTNTFPQKYYLYEKKGYVRAPTFCAGMYITNLIGACGIGNETKINNGVGYLESEAYSLWRSIVDSGNGDERRENFYIDNEKIANREESGLAAHYILYDSLGFLAYCISSNIKTTLKDVGRSLVKENWNEWSDCSRAVLGEQALMALQETADNNREYKDIVQSSIDGYTKDFNDLLMSSMGDPGSDFYHRLCACLRAYNDGHHRLIEQYLSLGRNGRCFATFISQGNNEKYVSFSGGTVDVCDPRILQWLRIGRPGFVDIAQQICSSLYATFVPLNLSTRWYMKNYNVVVPAESIADKIEQGADGSVVENFSCCERKIFGFFRDDPPDGALYVKFRLCDECKLGLEYQRRGHNIILYQGLGC